MKKNFKKYLLILLTSLILLPSAFVSKNIYADETRPVVGLVTGTVFGDHVLEDNPDAKLEFYNSTFDLPIALQSGKIDAYALDEPVGRMLCNIYEDQIIAKKLSFESYGIIVNKSQNKLFDQLNEFIIKMNEDGELDTLQKKWIEGDEENKFIDFKSIENNGPVIKLATYSNLEPFDYIKDGQFAGYEIDLIVNFCKEYGYSLVIEDSNFSGVLASVASGKSDIGTSVITITEERKETMDITEPIYQGGTVYVKRKQTQTEEINSLKELDGKPVGVQLGATFDDFLKEEVSNPKIEYFRLVSDMVSSLDSNKISAFVVDKNVAQEIINEYGEDYKILDSIKSIRCGFALPKDSMNTVRLYTELDDFIKKIRKEGVLDEINNVWAGNDNSLKVINKEGLKGENGTLTVAVSSSVGAPVVYIKNDELIGRDIDILYRFAREYGYDLKFQDYSINSLFEAITRGECDIGAAEICITDKREEQMHFPESYYESECVVVTKNTTTIDNTTNEDAGFFERIATSFRNTFIKEDRWKMFLSGIFTTVYITLISIVLGSALGFGAYMLYRNTGKVSRTIMDVISNIILKTPIVVMLMILYYIVFGKFSISGKVVSIIGLTIIFANNVKALLDMGVKSINESQYDAALALGYSKNKGFIRMILPQAIINIISGYKSAIINLIKDSSIVGYIAVQDLTKVSDIIRSRTFEAFFPLITTALIYYVITTLFIVAVSKIKIKGKHNKLSTTKK